VNVNSILNYQMKPDNALTLHSGLGLRNARAGLIYLGASIKDIRVGLAFDLDLSSSSIITNSSKSIELAVSYIGKIYKKLVKVLNSRSRMLGKFTKNQSRNQLSIVPVCNKRNQ